ncbi:hypothetical protein T484DRAFT_1769457, partial [Baffinella frigidus]
VREGCLALLEAEHARDLHRHRKVEALCVSEEARGAVLGAALAAEHADRSAASSALVVALAELETLGIPETAQTPPPPSASVHPPASAIEEEAALLDAGMAVVGALGTDTEGAGARSAGGAGGAGEAGVGARVLLAAERARRSRAEAVEELLEEEAGLRARVNAASARLFCPASTRHHRIPIVTNSSPVACPRVILHPLGTPVALKDALGELSEAKTDLDEKLMRIDQLKQTKDVLGELPEAKTDLDEKLMRIDQLKQAPRAPLPDLFHDFFLHPDALNYLRNLKENLADSSASERNLGVAVHTAFGTVAEAVVE